jgi:hypothetical protein
VPSSSISTESVNVPPVSTLITYPMARNIVPYSD